MTNWNIDQAHTEIGFKVKHLMVSTVRGKFSAFEGTVEASDETFTDAKIAFSIDAASITTGNNDRDAHLKSPDFFKTDEFPKITFVSTSFVKKEGNLFIVTGDLSMRGVTKQISFNAAFNGVVTDAYGKRVASFDITGTINRLDFGVAWNAALEAGGVVVSPDVQLDMTVELTQA